MTVAQMAELRDLLARALAIADELQLDLVGALIAAAQDALPAAG